jgi:hypothetical protein
MTSTQFKINVIRSSKDWKASHDSVSWALSHLSNLLKDRGITLEEGVLSQGSGTAQGSKLNLFVAGSDPALIPLQSGGTECPSVPEAFCILKDKSKGDLAVIGADSQGLVYGLLELADRVQCNEDALRALMDIESYSEQPANKIRSINRIFTSEIEDKPWFYDRSFWQEYLTELATHRFNRFHLAFGMGYDYGHDPDVRDNYLCFAYPFLLDVHGFDVKAKGLSAGERERNLEMLRFISSEARRRGIHFQLGLWNHAYLYAESPNENYKIEGVDAHNHAAYCHAALRQLLESCPDIAGVTIRVHYEGGIPEPSYVFWTEVFQGLTECGRPVEIDMHPKGVDEQMLQVAENTGMPVIVSPKYWAEHLGLPYHQAAIRARELPVASTDRPDLMSVTATYRRFTRYGYADYLRVDRKAGVLHRIWPGTQRVLLWGDPATAAGYGRSGSFCGSLGMELCEPLSFKSRKNSGSSGGRELYKEAALQLGGQEWRKYLYTYRLWGRLLYNPDADPSAWRRYLQKEFGAASTHCEQALAHASRVLPLITSAHLPSAANNHFWPEMYTNMAIVDTGKPSPYYSDTPEPGTFSAVSPLDPAMFYRITDYASDLFQGNLRGKYSPLAVADWLTTLAETAEGHLSAASKLTGDPSGATYRRWATDITVLALIGHFFARKIRAAVSYALYEQTENKEQLKAALNSYRSAKSSWEEIIAATKDVYKDNIAFGYKRHAKGSWSDRLAEIEEDIVAMEQVYLGITIDGKGAAAHEATSALAVSGSVTKKDRPSYTHETPSSFVRGSQVVLTVRLSTASDVTVRLLYRHLNQAEAYQEMDMDPAEERFTAVIPGSYTDSSYPIVYFFELQNQLGEAWIAPGFNEDLSNQPYYVLHQQ